MKINFCAAKSGSLVINTCMSILQNRNYVGMPRASKYDVDEEVGGGVDDEEEVGEGGHVAEPGDVHVLAGGDLVGREDQPPDVGGQEHPHDGHRDPGEPALAAAAGGGPVAPAEDVAAAAAGGGLVAVGAVVIVLDGFLSVT